MQLETRPKHEDIEKNRLLPKDEPIHNWYRFVLGYPPHLVRQYLEKFEADPERDLVFDPFSGTGTTPVEARLGGFATVATDANPITALATRVKLRWGVDLVPARERLVQVLAQAQRNLATIHLECVPANEQLALTPVDTSVPEQYRSEASTDFDPSKLLPEQARKVIPTDFISPRPLLRVLAVRHAVESLTSCEIPLYELFSLALASTIVADAGNMGFGPEVYLKKPLKEDVDVLGIFSRNVSRMIDDLEWVGAHHSAPFPPASVFRDDARSLDSLRGIQSIGIVITSPPYPNEKDYTRSTRLESVLLGLMEDKVQLRQVKQYLLRSNTRNVFVNDDDDRLVADVQSINHFADEIEAKRRQLGKTSGFEKLYHRVIRHYFGGMHRHLTALYHHLRPGARLAYVVGDQASFFQVMVPTAALLADVAIRAGYEVEGIELWRTRWSSATKQNIDENVLILRRKP